MLNFLPKIKEPYFSDFLLYAGLSANHAAFLKTFDLDKRGFLSAFCQRFNCPGVITKPVGDNYDVKRSWLSNLKDLKSNWKDQFQLAV